MQLARVLGLALLAARAHGQLLPAGSASGVDDESDHDVVDALQDRVVVVSAGQKQLNGSCMGVLIAPSAVLTYAHCVVRQSKKLSWAYFGPSSDSSQETNRGDGDVGDEDDWVPIVQTTVHPKYVDDGSTPTMDLAVVHLSQARIATEPFSLADNMTESNVAAGWEMEAFQMSNRFLTSSRGRKVMSHGAFKKISWNYCVASRTNINWKLYAGEPKGQLCVVASVVEDRVPRQLADTFVVLDGKLVGLNVPQTSASTSHRIIFLSNQRDFITQATEKGNVWIPVSSFVVGGKPSATLKGYLTGLRLTKAGPNFCLGSLIAPKFVLTAAHCVQGVNFTQTSVGSMYAATEIDGEQIKVKQTIIHPKFVKETFVNDYAIVELEYISIQTPIPLYDAGGSDIAGGKRLTLYGYSATVGNKPGELESVDLPVVDKKTCALALSPPVLDDSMLCAGGEEGKDGCKGDSGGPLVFQSKSPTSLVAMASYGRGCGMKGMPAVYSVVATASDFIDKYVDGHRWITAYGSNTPAPSSAPNPTPVVSNVPSSLTQTPCAAPSSSPATTTSPQTGRSSGSASSPSGSSLTEEIVDKENWTPVSSMLFKASNDQYSLTIDQSSSSRTRDALSTTLLSARTSLDATQIAKYSGAKSLEFVSSADLSELGRIISSFDRRLLSRRVSRFSPSVQDDVTSPCIAHR